MFGAFDAKPPEVEPNWKVAVPIILLAKAPVPVQVKLLAVAIASAVVPAVVPTNTMFCDPKVMARVLLLLELKIPVVNVKPLSAIVPAVNVNVFADPKVQASPSVKVEPEALNVMLPCVFPPLVIVDAAFIVSVPV